MANGNTLVNIRGMLKAELGDSTQTNTARDAQLNVLLSNKQKWLASEYQWSFLERRWLITIPANTQYVGLPTVDDAGVTTSPNTARWFPEVDVLWSTVYQPVAYGIGIDEYNTMDFSRGQQSNPVQKWRLSSNPNETSNPNQFEVWPVPTMALGMRFVGQRQLLPLVSDNDTADLDDMLLVYAVAGDLLTRAKQADAAIKIEEFKRRLKILGQSMPSKDVQRTLGGGVDRGFKDSTKLVGMTIAVH